MPKPSLHPLILACVAIVFIGCGGVPEGTPECIAEIADDLQSQPVANPPRSITEYEYTGQAVYFIPAACCNELSSLLDAQCRQICSPDGWQSATGDGKCPDFHAVAVKKRTIWQDDRTPPN
jgi:hypothetical protein